MRKSAWVYRTIAQPPYLVPWDLDGVHACEPVRESLEIRELRDVPQAKDRRRNEIALDPLELLVRRRTANRDGLKRVHQ